MDDFNDLVNTAVAVGLVAAFVFAIAVMPWLAVGVPLTVFVALFFYGRRL